MRFLLDASVRLSLGVYLQSEGFDVRFMAGTPDHDLDDEAVLSIAVRENRVLVTNDRDFGTLVFHHRLPHRGVIFFRLADESAGRYREKMQLLLRQYDERLQDHYLVVTDAHIRFR